MNTLNSILRCAVAEVPAPPAVTEGTPVPDREPARLPAEPAAVEVILPYGAMAPVDTDAGTESAFINVSENVNA